MKLLLLLTLLSFTGPERDRLAKLANEGIDLTFAMQPTDPKVAKAVVHLNTHMVKTLDGLKDFFLAASKFSSSYSGITTEVEYKGAADKVEKVVKILR